jgi:lipoprotein-anchoring transpeptidase ErfK/SrfK
MLMSRLRNWAVLACAVAATACVPDMRGEQTASPQIVALAQTLSLQPVAARVDPAPEPAAASVEPPAPPPPPSPPKVNEVLNSGVVITISLASQQMHVFRDGVLWRSSPVSTGKRGKRTPVGVYALLQKKKFHRSNLYSNAPMPFMQRLTWSGIAIHAGHLPGYPASHGCIRVPRAFAQELYQITDPAATAVIITDAPLKTAETALALAQASDAVVPISPVLLARREAALARKADDAAAVRPPAARLIPPPPPVADPPPSAPTLAGRGQTIQLAAARSARIAQAHWAGLAARRPELKAMQMAIVPALVNGTQYYRLRASAPGAHATCKVLKRDGIACFPVS